MLGLNSDVQFYRAEQIADDDVGGAQRGPYIACGSARARISQRPATIEMRAQGLTTDRLFDAFVQPATVDVLNNDMMMATSGPYAHVRFRVTGVIQPHMLKESARAHLKIQLERVDDGRNVDLIWP